MSTTSFRRKWKDLQNGFRSETGEGKSSQNLNSREPTPPTTSNSCAETPEAGPDQEIIRRVPWTMYTAASTPEKEALELALLVEVAKSSDQFTGDHDPTIIQKLYSDLLRNNQDFKVIFLCCWKTGCFQDVRSHDSFLSIQPPSLQPIAVDVDNMSDMFIESNRAGERQRNVTENSSKAGGQTINIHGSTFNNGGNIQVTCQLKQIFYSDNHESKIPEWLSSLEYSDTHNGLRQRQTPGTGAWFLCSEEFMSWINDPDRNILWCPGIPGAGKTIIASLVIDHLREHTKDTAVIYIYFTYKLHDRQSLATSVQTLSRQVHEICRRKEIPSDFEDLYISHLEHKTRPSMDELLEALRTTLKHFKKQVYVILDALDEYLKLYSDEKIRQLITTVQSFGAHVKILATSRDIGDMKNLFKELYAIKKEITADSKDLQAFVNAGITALNHLDVSAQLSKQVIKKVEEAANGRFLMAELHMNALQEQLTAGDLEESLISLSSEVEETYKLAMERMEKLGSELNELAKRTLMWVAYTRRPMTVGELQHALATKHGRTDITNYLPSISTITSACVGLVVIQDGKVAFVHLTTQEFFDEHQARYFPQAHKEIGRTCLDYILLPCFLNFASTHLSNIEERHDSRHQFRNDLYKSYPFYDYAALNWGIHVNRYGLDEALAESILVALKQVDDRLKLAWTHTLRGMALHCSMYDVGLDGAGLFLALYHQQKAAFAALIDRKHIPTTKKRRTPFIIAAYLGLPDFIELMMQTWVADDSHPRQSPGSSQLPRTEESDNIVRDYVASPDDAGYTPLWYAVDQRHTAVVKLLLQCSATQVNTSHDYGWPPLILAAARGYDDITELLLKCPMLDINSQNQKGKTALQIAARKGLHDLVKLLLEHPAIDVNLADHDGVSPFLAASERGDTSSLKLLLDYRRPCQPMESLQDTVGRLTVDVNTRNKSGWSALSFAAWDGHLPAVELLIDHTDIDLDLRSSHGGSPLAMASQQGHADIVHLLLDRAPVDINCADKDGDTPLICAAYNGHAVVAKVLLAQPGIQVNVQDGIGRTALSRACDRAMTPNEDGKEKTEAKACSFVALLLEHKNIDISLADEEGKTPLYYATRSGFQKVVKLMQGRGAVYDDATTELLVKWVMKLDINSQDTGGNTALRIAAGTGFHNMVKLLLEHPAIDVNLANHDGVSPFLAASRRGDTSTLKLLLDYQKPCQPVDSLQDTVGSFTVDVNARTKSGWSALAFAAREGCLPAIELLLNHTDIGPDLRISHGCSPLALASEYGHADIVQLLLDRAPVNMNNIDDDGDTPLICAAYNGHASVAKVLLDQPGIQVNVQDGRGRRTALSRACDAATTLRSRKKTEAEAYSFVALLLEHNNIDVNLADEEERTPLYYASRSGFQRVVELMQGRGAVMSSNAESTPTNDLL